MPSACARAQCKEARAAEARYAPMLQAHACALSGQDLRCAADAESVDARRRFTIRASALPYIVTIIDATSDDIICPCRCFRRHIDASLI